MSCVGGCSACLPALLVSILFFILGSTGLKHYLQPIDGLHAAKCSFLSLQDHGSTDCRYCKE